MKEEFLKKLNHNEYISNFIYENVYNNYKEIIPNNFDLDSYNEKILDKEYIKYKDYFQNMYKGIDDNIKLDEEQSKAILADEDYALIIAGAGTGKTTTMASKVKYLVDIKKIDPSKILVMSYTKKATVELKERIVDSLGIDAHVTTFHSLGNEYIRRIFKDRKCIVIDKNERENIFLEYFKNIFKDKEKVAEIIEYFEAVKNNHWMFSRYFKEHYNKFSTYEEFFDNYKIYKMNEAKNVGLRKIIDRRIEKDITGDVITTINGEIVKSAAEAVIANFLFTHGIDYAYEQPYSELMDDYRVYKPDFTLDLGGENVYIEYFGLNDAAYIRNKKKKEEFHKHNKTKFIEIDRVSLNNIEKVLNSKLLEMGFIYNNKTDEEIYDRILDKTPSSQIYPFKDFLFACIDLIKNSRYRMNYDEIVNAYINSLGKSESYDVKIQYKYINEFYKFYQSKLYGSEIYKFDYCDLLYYSNKYINNVGTDGTLDFEYIIIDEYQDISKDKYDLAKNTADRNNAKVFAVGDDWQSIYAFSGSRIDYIYNFNKYFNGTKTFRITKTYRNSQELINYTGEFIMKNTNQIKKELWSDNHIDHPIKIFEYDSEEELNYKGYKFNGYQEYINLISLILKIHEKHPERKILVLGRNNSMIDRIYKFYGVQDDLDTKITFIGYDDLELEGMTMHSSKGLTFDEVIIIGLNNKFPYENNYPYWLVKLFRNPILEESIPFAEERRLFYVALTRTKNHVYLLADKNESKRSEFLKEIISIINEETITCNV